MKRRTVVLIAGGVVAAHLVAFYFLCGWNPLPKVPYIPPPNFSLGWAKFKDPVTHDKMVYQEFTVSTQLKSAPAGDSSPRPAQ